MLSNQILLKPTSVVRVLGSIAVLLILASVGARLVTYLTGHDEIYGLLPLFNLDNERNIPTFFSVFLLLFADLLLWIVTILKRNQKAAYISHWALLSFGFLFMAADEASVIHELLVRPMRILLGDGKLGVFFFSWVIPGMAIVLVLALFFLRFLLNLPPKTRLHFLLAAIVYLGGAIGLELIEGSIYEMYGQNFLYIIFSNAEESLEMAGIIIFIWALLVYIAENFKEVLFMFVPVGGKATPSDPKTSTSAPVSCSANNLTESKPGWMTVPVRVVSGSRTCYTISA